MRAPSLACSASNTPRSASVLRCGESPSHTPHRQPRRARWLRRCQSAYRRVLPMRRCQTSTARPRQQLITEWRGRARLARRRCADTERGERSRPCTVRMARARQRCTTTLRPSTCAPPVTPLSTSASIGSSRSGGMTCAPRSPACSMRGRARRRARPPRCVRCPT